MTAGDRVRLTAPNIGIVKRQIFTLVGVTADSITLSPIGQDITIDCSIADLSSLQAQRGQKRATWRGLVIVGATGAAIGILAGLAAGSDPPDELYDMSTGEKALAGGVSLGLLGGAVGALLGSTVKVDRWEKVPIQVRVAPSDIVARGFAVSASTPPLGRSGTAGGANVKSACPCWKGVPAQAGSAESASQMYREATVR